jgi:hypothetical protein
MNLLKQIDVELASTSIAGVTDQTTSYSTIVDCEGFDSVLWLAWGSTAVGLSKTTCPMRAQGSTGNSTTAMVTYNGRMSVADTTAAMGNNRLILFDCHRIQHRYQRVAINGDCSGLVTFVAIKYNGRVPGSTWLNVSTTIRNSTTIICSTY